MPPELFARFLSGRHDPSCTGCPACKTEHAAAMTAMSENLPRRLRTNTSHAFRTSAPRQPQPERKTLEQWSREAADGLGVGSINLAPAPDPYAGIRPRAPQPSDTPGYDPYGTPPNGYAIAMANKKGTR